MCHLPCDVSPINNICAFNRTFQFVLSTTIFVTHIVNSAVYTSLPVGGILVLNII